MSKEVYIKLVGAERYTCPLLKNGNDDVILQNDILPVTREVADIILKDKKYDASNNEHPVFIEVDEEEVAAAEAESAAEEEEAAAAVVAEKPVGRVTRTKK